MLRRNDRQTLVDVLRARATELPELPGFSFLIDGETQEETCTYAELDRAAKRIAHALVTLGSTSGDRVLLLCAPGIDYIAGFFGCLYAGLVAVPAYPPDPARLPRTLPRVQAIARDSGAQWIVTTRLVASMSEMVVEQAPELEALEWLVIDEVLPELAERWTEPDVQPDSLAFIQYTSGSTGVPKGVMLSHQNLVANAQAITASFGITDASRGVFWLPPYHDMGLIGGILQPLSVGRPAILMSPFAFLRRPARWLEAISRTGGTISGAPNFAYDLCVRKVTDADIQGLDLRTWSCAFCGAEPVRAETLDRFAERFEVAGFRREAFLPCYGLAEATLFVTGGEPDKEPTAVDFVGSSIDLGVPAPPLEDEGPTRTLVGCGAPAPGHDVRIVDPTTLQPLEDGRVGEVWVAGPSIALGYWRGTEAAERSFNAELSTSPDTRYLRTGDLGFFHDSELFIAGRLKDVIVIRGRNCHAQDIELSVEHAHAALRPGCGAAFSVEEGGTERLVVVHELERRWRRDRRVNPPTAAQPKRSKQDRRHADPTIEAFHPGSSRVPPPSTGDFGRIIDAIRSAVASEHDIQPFAVLLLKAGAVPKTTSGKIQRSACRRYFASGAFDPVFEWRRRVTSSEELRPTSSAGSHQLVDRPGDSAEIATWLRGRLADLLRVRTEDIDESASVLRYGVDSLQSVEIQNSIESRYGMLLPAATLLKGPSIRELAEQIFAGYATSHDRPRARSTGSRVPLSFSQERIWFLGKLEPDSPMYNISAAISLTGRLSTGALQHALNEIVRRHDTLRLLFSDKNGVPVAEVQPWAPRPLSVHDLTEDADQDEALHRILAEEARQPLSLDSSPLIRWQLVRRAEEHHVLVVTMHHIVSDAWSVGVFSHELGILYGSSVNAETSPLRPLRLQYSDYAQWERERLDGSMLQEGVAYWKQKLAGAPTSVELPRDRPRPAVQSFRGARYALDVDRELGVALRGLSKRHEVTPYMVLLGAFYLLLHRHTSATDIVAGCVSANRSRAQFDDLIGFFANTLALRTDLSGNPSFAEVLERVANTTTEAYEYDYVPFEQVVEAVRPARDPGRNPLVQAVIVLQNAPLTPQDLPGLEMTTAELDTQAARFDLLLGVWPQSHGGYSLSFEYASDLFDESTIAALAEDFVAILQRVTERPEESIDQLLAEIEIRTLSVAVAATFTADMVAAPLEAFLDRVHLPSRVLLAPYNQLMQQLLDPGSLFATNAAGANCALVRLEDLGAKRPDVGAWAEDISDAIDELAGALRGFARRSRVPLFLGVCPPSDRWISAEASELHDGLARRLLKAARRIRGTVAVDLLRGVKFYDVDRVNAPFTDELGHIPYEENAFIAFAACLARGIFAHGAGYRTLVVDPIDVLWSLGGSSPPVAGNRKRGALLGPSKSARRQRQLTMSPPQQRVQELMVRLRTGGLRLALSTRGQERDILSALRSRRDMPLDLRHFHSWRVSHESVVDRLRHLSKELRSPLASIVFLSSHQADRELVQQELPDVLSVPLPGASFDAPDKLANLWTFYIDDETATVQTDDSSIGGHD